MSSGRRSLRSRNAAAEETEENNIALDIDELDDDDDDYDPNLLETEDDDAEVEAEYEEMNNEDDEDEDESEYVDFEDEDDEDGEASNGQARAGTIYLSRNQLMQVLENAGIRNLSWWGQDEDDEFTRRRSIRRRTEQYPKEPVPNDKGEKLLFEGVFGNNERRASRVATDKRLARRILERELGGHGYGREKIESSLMKQDLIPSSVADTVISYDARCSCGQFSFDGSFFLGSGRDMIVRMYDTSNPYGWKYYKSVHSTSGGWHVTDASLSNDNRFVAFCSLSSTVSFASTDPNDRTPARPLDFSRYHGRWIGLDNRVGYIFSVRFSGDGREIVGGAGGGGIYVFDIERDATVLKLDAHSDDVNAVCFGDQNSPHILYSGSDDATIKVWDRRSLADGRPAGVFLGHVEGVTYVDSKGDGVYVISNCKDQTAKLWDIRKIHSTEKADTVETSTYSQGWDYRSGHYDQTGWKPHPYDCSLVTFRGHSVERTLIRCHFSPPGSTDGRYVYSGSRDGKVYIWNLDATLKETLDVSASSSSVRGRRVETSRIWDGTQRHETIVRDVSWHPNAPIIAASAWSGYGIEEGVVTVHSWTDGVDIDEMEDVTSTTRRFDSEMNPYEEAAARRRRMRGYY